jgi:phenazine biosynthesis protein phzE
MRGEPVALDRWRLPAGRRVLVVDAEDAFTTMLGHQIRALGAEVTTVNHDGAFEPDGYDVVVLGPGPGDPRDLNDPKIATMRKRAEWLLATGQPLLAVCLGHQVLSDVLGLPLIQREQSYQGLQRTIDLFGREVRVGFYSSFAARSDTSEFRSPLLSAPVDVCRAPDTAEVHALAGTGFRSFQFHPESVLSPDGLEVVSVALAALMPLRSMVDSELRQG